MSSGHMLSILCKSKTCGSASSSAMPKTSEFSIHMGKSCIISLTVPTSNCNFCCKISAIKQIELSCVSENRRKKMVESYRE